MVWNDKTFPDNDLASNLSKTDGARNPLLCQNMLTLQAFTNIEIKQTNPIYRLL